MEARNALKIVLCATASIFFAIVGLVSILLNLIREYNLIGITASATLIAYYFRNLAIYFRDTL